MEAPQIEAKITSGALSLTNLVLSQLENQSTRQAEKIVCGISPEMLARKKELHFNLIDDDTLREKLESIYKAKSPSAPGTSKKTGTTPVASGPPAAAASRVACDHHAPSQAEVRRHVWQRHKGRWVDPQRSKIPGCFVAPAINGRRSSILAS